MRDISRSLAFLACFLLTACNFPNQQPVVLAADTKAAITTPRLEPTPTKTVLAQIPTETSNPIPTSGPILHLDAGSKLAISYIDMIDQDNGWAIGGATGAPMGDHVLQTIDGGSSWKDVTPPEKTVVDPATDRIAVGAFWDTDTAWVTFYSSNLLLPSEAPVVWKTGDGGATWTFSAPLDLSGWVGEYRVSDLFFININTGWIFAHKGNDPKSDRIALYQTVNGGNTWERKIDPAIKTDVQDCEKTGILFTGPWIGWMTGDCLGERPGVFLYQTYDGGKSWEESKLPSPATPAGMLTTPEFSCRIHPPLFFAQRTQLVLNVECTSKNTKDTASYLYSTESSGWHAMTYPGGLMVVRSPGDGRVFRGAVESGVILGKESFIYNGKTGEWEMIESIDWTGQFDFVDWNKGWAAARKENNPYLMYTKDGGRSWTDLEPVVVS